MKKRTSIVSVVLMIMTLGFVSCSHIDNRSPSSLKTQVGQCKMIADESGKQYQVFVNDKAYPSEEKYSAAEAHKLLTRFEHTGTCNW